MIRKQRKLTSLGKTAIWIHSKTQKNEVVNLSLLAKNYESDEEVTSSNNNLSISFDELQDAFIDLHKESVKLRKRKF